MSEKPVTDEKGGATANITADSDHGAEKGGALASSTAVVVNNNIIPIYGVVESRSHQLKIAWLYLIATTVLCAWTVSFAYSALVSNEKVPRYYDFSPTRTLRMLNVASVLCILLVKSLVSAVFDAFSWALASAPGGTGVQTFRATQKTTDSTDVGKLLLTFGKHQKWCIMRLLITALTIVASILLMSEITSGNVYNQDKPFPVLAGLADLHESVLALDKSNVFGNTSTVQETSINMMILGSTRSILTDPTLAIPIPATKCKEADCQSIFLPGGLGLVRYLHNGSALSADAVPSANGAIVIHNAPGYQMEFASYDYPFNHPVDCTYYGLPVSGIYSCIKYENDTIYTGISICPFNLMEKASCESDNTWNTGLDASLALSLFQRNATVAYDKSNFSILSIEKIDDPQPATHPNITADFQRMFSVMYPSVSNIINDVAGAVLHPDTVYPELAYWASVYCVQSEVSSANWLYQNKFPTWVTGERDILAGFLAIPVQFGTLLWQWVDLKDMPAVLQTNATGAKATYRARVKPWTVLFFAVIVFAIVLWAIACLVFVHVRSAGTAQHSSTLDAAFRNGNPFEVADEGIWNMFRAVLCCFCIRPNKAGVGGSVEEDVVVRSLENDTLVVIKQ